MIYEELYVGFGNPLTTSLFFLTNTDTIATPIYMNHIERWWECAKLFQIFYSNKNNDISNSLNKWLWSIIKLSILFFRVLYFDFPTVSISFFKNRILKIRASRDYVCILEFFHGNFFNTSSIGISFFFSAIAVKKLYTWQPQNDKQQVT